MVATIFGPCRYHRTILFLCSTSSGEIAALENAFGTVRTERDPEFKFVLSHRETRD